MTRTDKKNRTVYIDFIVFVSPLLFTLACIVLYKIFHPAYDAFAASALAYGIKAVYTVLTFICSLLCFFITLKLFKKRMFFHFIIYFIFFISLFFLFLELIHYGQKIYSPQTSGHALALHEIVHIRPIFDAAFFIMGFYASFYWVRFIKVPRVLKFSTARLYVPDFSLLFYFLPIIVFFIVVNYLEYVSHLAINTNFTSVIKSHSWLFELNRFFPHYSRLLLATGLFIFFLKTSIWINHTDTLQNNKLKYSSKEFIVLLILLFLIMSGFVIGSRQFTTLADLGWGKYFEINNDLNGAVHHYNECIKKNDNAYAHKALFLLYHRMGDDDSAIQHLSRAIKKSMAAGNQKMTTELFKTGLMLYPNSSINPETRTIYFQK